MLGMTAARLDAQMMAGGRDVRGGRQAMTERLANVSPEQRAFLETLRAGGEETYSAQSVTLTAETNRLRSGPVEVSEWLMPVSYFLRRPGMALWISGQPTHFESGDTLHIDGISTLQVRLDLGLWALDSLRLGVRGATSPSTLSTSEVAALESIGTSTLDLSSIQFGTPAGVEARFTHVQPLDAATELSVIAGGEYEPRPSDEEWSYWRGKTVRVGVGVSRLLGGGRIGGGVDVTRSFSDSLGGQNLFQGGGTILARVDAATAVGDAGSVLVGGSVSYFRSYSASRAAAAGPREPSGDFVGVSTIAVWPIRAVFFTPAVVLSYESNEASTGTTVVAGSGWSLGTSLAASVPLARRFTFTPEVGHVTGSRSTDFLTTVGSLTQRAETTGSLSGWWLAADVSLSF
jgi:hypothetical protein